MSQAQTAQPARKTTKDLSRATQTAIALFKRHESKRFYSARMLEVEEAAMAAIPPHEFADYVRITSEYLGVTD